jgi:formate dehydrogenase major subunit
LPFIMTGEGTGRLFSNGVADGPFPEHYEPIESPVDNPLHPSVSATPVAFLYDARPAGPTGSARGRVPVRRHVYRLTEHEHYVTQHVEQLVRLQPEAFVEVRPRLAEEKGIATGDHVGVSSKRGKLEVGRW